MPFDEEQPVVVEPVETVDMERAQPVAFSPVTAQGGPQQAIPLGMRPQRPGVTSVGGIMEMRSLDQMLADEKAAAEAANNKPEITGLAGHIRACWQEAKQAKEQTIEKRMLQNLRQRRGEYDQETVSRLRQQNSTLIYMMVTSNKCRAAQAWLQEALQGLPWRAEPTPVADIDTQTQESIIQLAAQQIQQSMMLGIFPSDAEVREFMLAVRDQAFAQVQEIARTRAERMTEKMKDQLIEGGFEDALNAFIDDLVTFPAAILKGPVVRTRPQLKWTIGQDGQVGVEAKDAFKLEWERVDPFNIYPAPDATNVDDGYLIERHKLSRSDLVSLRAVEGYSTEAINAVLDDYGRGGLTEWLTVDSDREVAEGRNFTVRENPSELIDALQFWGSVQGKMLIDWGVPPDEVEDPLAEYHIEAWLVGNWVIKATVNPDPLHRKPYYKTSWENVPGCFWGNSIPDLCADTQAVCNAAARTLVNNMSISSGPQVAVNVSALPVGADLTEMYPWKIWQVRDTGTSTVQPISFFQPSSNASELMGVFEKFSTLADEYTGIPRYMTGDGAVGGAGRTASGMSMLMTNAGKSIKNVVSSVDRVLKPAIERLYFYNMRHLDDPELKGDVNIVVRGAAAMVEKQAQQQRLNEFLNISTSNPVINQIIGAEGIAYMLREVAKTLGMDTDKIVPALPVLKARMAQAQMQAALQQQAAMQAQAQGQPQAGGSNAGPTAKTDQRQLENGAPSVQTQAGPSGAPR
nr:MAG TPA: Portal protein [Caudoviricetes sp.]